MTAVRFFPLCGLLLGAPLAAQMAAPDSLDRLRSVDTIPAGDGGRVTVTTIGRTGIVVVSASTPSGTFWVRLPPGASAAWADSATGTVARVAQTDTLIRGARTMQLRRLSDDSAYELMASNGAWDGTVVLSHGAAQQLFIALRHPSTLRSLVDVGPTETRTAVPFAGLNPRYPRSLLKAHVTGRVVMRFLIDSTGHVDPSSISLLRSPHPLMSLSARDALVAFTFLPATAAGRPVNQLVVQGFDFGFRR